MHIFYNNYGSELVQICRNPIIAAKCAYLLHLQGNATDRNHCTCKCNHSDPHDDCIFPDYFKWFELSKAISTAFLLMFISDISPTICRYV